MKTKLCDDGIERIYDPLRQRWVALTPEEMVRQRFTAYLIDHLGYPPTLMANEVTINLNGMSRRCDTVLYSRHGLQPQMIVEYKAATVPITEAVFNQILRYNIVLRVPWLVVSNGLNTYCCHITYDPTPKATFLPSLPHYSDLTAV